MTVRALISEAKKLSPEERWELVEELMQMAHGERADTALTPSQQADLRRRMEEARSGTEELIPGEVGEAMLRNRQ